MTVINGKLYGGCVQTVGHSAEKLAEGVRAKTVEGSGELKQFLNTATPKRQYTTRYEPPEGFTRVDMSNTAEIDARLKLTSEGTMMEIKRPDSNNVEVTFPIDAEGNVQNGNGQLGVHYIGLPATDAEQNIANHLGANGFERVKEAAAKIWDA